MPQLWYPHTSVSPTQLYQVSPHVVASVIASSTLEGIKWLRFGRPYGRQWPPAGFGLHYHIFVVGDQWPRAS